jgi:NAD(P)H-nitrite reductase large subunit
MSDEILICRCEEVTEQEIKDAIKNGASTVDGVKRVTRAGKGLCQGRTCRCLVENLISRETKTPVEELEYPNNRPPVRVMKVKALAELDKEDQ